MITLATSSCEIAELPATANGDKAGQNASKTIRDKACTHLKEGGFMVVSRFQCS
jgi:hypothetical protein